MVAAVDIVCDCAGAFVEMPVCDRGNRTLTSNTKKGKRHAQL